YGPSRGARAIPLLDGFVGRLESGGVATARRSVPEGGVAAIDDEFTIRDRMLGEVGRQECVGRPAFVSRPVNPAYARLGAQAAAARARGVALRMAETLAGEDGRAWMANRLYGPLWRAGEVDETIVETLEALATATVPSLNPGIPVGSTFDFGIGPGTCALSIN